jgi:hypothetical protein
VTIAVMVASVGAEPVELQLDPDTFTALLETADGASRWEPIPRPPIGLVDVGANLLDGLVAAATIPPGVTGALTVRLEAGSDEVRSIHARLGGLVALRGPISGLDIPTARFVVVTPTIAIG